MKKRSTIKLALEVSIYIYFIKPFYLDACFNKYVFWRWIFYGIWQALVILYVCFYSMEVSADSDGKYSAIEVDGQFVYMSVVTIANVKILTSTHTHTFISLFFSIGSTLMYMLCFWFLNLFVNNELFGLFDKVFFHNNFYFALFFVGLAVISVDIGLHLA